MNILQKIQGLFFKPSTLDQLANVAQTILKDAEVLEGIAADVAVLYPQAEAAIAAVTAATVGLSDLIGLLQAAEKANQSTVVKPTKK